ncbi:MAG TPA: outer membrane protein transport protein [Chthoniobacteraceae bacterium]|jgi:long-chain fatty acid transport protein|nr:outer membrane protein transport protein [Chthoniobacteraceae bacterium]
MRIRTTLPSLGFLLLAPAIAFGYGDRVATQDAEATARGNAFTATADDPAAIYYNPAGLMQMDGFNVEVGGYGIWIDEQYKPLHGADGGHDSTAHEPLQGVPQFFASYHPANEPFSFGFGAYCPFGLKTEWPDDFNGRSSGLDASLDFVSFTPTMAVQITRSLSFGLGVSANYENAELREGLSSSPGDYFQIKGDGFSVGGDAGLLWKPTARQAIGITYHSPVSGNLAGHTTAGLSSSEISQAKAGNAAIAAGKAQLEAGIAQINALPLSEAEKQALIAKAQAQYQSQLAAAGVPASGSFPTSIPTEAASGSLHFPQYVTLGYSFRPTPDWNIEADVDWTDWDSLNSLAINQASGTTVNVPFNWKNSFLYELGATHTIGAYRLSAGYIYSENSVPSGSFNPVAPDSARHIVSVGVGRTFGKCSVDLAYELSIGVNRTIVNDTTADGRYSFLANAVSLSLGYHF